MREGSSMEMVNRGSVGEERMDVSDMLIAGSAMWYDPKSFNVNIR